MKIYWTLKSIPELKDYPPEERKKIWRAGFWNSFKQGRAYTGFYIAALPMLLGIFIGNAIGRIHGVFIGGGIGGAIGVFVFLQFLVRSALPYIKETVSKRSAPKES
jgi:hypothetical protein